MGQRTRDKILDEYEREIRNAMARTLWVQAYAAWVEGLSAYERADLIESSGGDSVARMPPAGGNWDEYAPETPQAAHQAARDLAELFGKAEGVGRRRPMITLYELAMHADTGEAQDVSKLFGSGEKDRRRGPQWALFAHYMTMESLGHGVSWFDDHANFDITFPTFEVNYNGVDELTWWGRLGDERGITARQVGDTFSEYSFLNVTFRPDGWNRVLAALRIKDDPGVVSVERQDLEEWWFLWIGKGIELLTRNDPRTGYPASDPKRGPWRPGSRSGIWEGTRIDHAGNIGVRGEAGRVDKAIALIREFALGHGTWGQYVEGRRGDFYARFPVAPAKLRKNANLIPSTECSTAYHDALKTDPSKWAKLEHRGYQHIEADEEGPAETLEYRDCDRCPSTLSKVMKGPPPGVPMRNGEQQRWRVWITGYRGSYSDVMASSYKEAMQLGAREQKASHHGETVELNAMPMVGDTAAGERQPYSEYVTLDRSGRITFVPAPDQLRQAHRRRH